MAEPIDVAAAELQNHMEWLAGAQTQGTQPVVTTSVNVKLTEQPGIEQLPAVRVALTFVGEVASMEVANRAGFTHAGEVVATLSKGIREAVKYKKDIREPMRRMLSEFDNDCNEVIGQLTTAKATLSDRMATWSHAEEVLNAQLQRDAEEAAAEVNRQLAEKARAAGLPEPPPVEVYVGPPPKSVATPQAGGKVTLTSRWTYDVEQPDLVPREYCTPNPGLLRDAVNKGVRSIPGVRIYQADSAGYRK